MFRAQVELGPRAYSKPSDKNALAVNINRDIPILLKGKKHILKNI